MKVLFVVTGIRAPAASGSEFIKDLILETTKLGVTATILSPTFIHTDKGLSVWSKKLETKYDVRFVWVNAPDFIKRNFLLHFFLSPFLVTIEVVKLLSRQSFDLVHEFTSTPIILIRGLIYRLFRVPSVFSLSVLNKSILGNFFWFRIFNFGSYYLIPSHEIVKHLIDLGVSAQKTAYLPPCINTSRLKINTPKDTAKKSLGLPVDRKVITYFGSLSEEKGVLTLLYASKVLPEEIKRKTSIVLFSYYLKDSKAYSNMAKKIKELAPENLKLYEKLVSIPLLLQASDFFIYPVHSGHGSTIPPISILEALASSVPVITTDLIGIRELIKPGVGVLIPPNNPEELTYAIENMITQKNNFTGFPDTEKFDTKNVALKLLNVYKTLNENKF